MRGLPEIIQDMVLNHPTKSVQQIVEEAFGFDEHGKPRKSHWTLYRELNTEDHGAKLGAIDLFLLMRVCGCIKPLEAQAAEFGMALIPATSKADKPSVELELLDVMEALNALKEKSLGSGSSRAQVMSALAGIIEQAKQVVDAWEKTQTEPGNVFRGGRWEKKVA